MSFFNSLYNSLYNFKWLRQQRDNTSWAWSYFFLLTFFVTGLTVIPSAFKYFSEAPNWKARIIQEVPEFQAQMKNGQLEVKNLPQPYIKKSDNSVLVVDTVSTGTLSIGQFLNGENKLGILVVKDHIEVYNPEDKKIKSQAFVAGEDVQFDRALVLEWAEKILSNKMLSLFTLGFSAIIFVYLVAGNLITIFFVSLLFYQVSKRRDGNYKFKQVFNIGLLAITLPLILGQLVYGVPYLSLIISVMFGFWMYWTLFKSEK